MNRHAERRRDLIGGVSFIILIVVLIVGGFFVTKYLTSDDQQKKVKKSEINQYKIDESKDLIYYKDEQTISNESEIVYKDVIINLKEADTVNELLKNKMEEIRSSVKKISESELDESREIQYSEDDIYYALERNYASYESFNFLSLVVTDGEFNCYDGSKINNITAYTFSLTNGKRLSNETLLGYASVSIDDVKNKVRAKLEKDQQEFTDGNSINIEETINGISAENSAIYANKSGKIAISYIVKTNEDSYNDTIELN